MSQPIFLEERKAISELQTKVVSAEDNAPSTEGVEMQQSELTKIRFATDRRLDEVARMLQSSAIPSVKMEERPMR